MRNSDSFLLFPVPQDENASTNQAEHATVALTRVNVQKSITSVMEELSDQLSQQGVDVTIDASSAIRVSADFETFCSALRCLCQNAIRCMPSGGELVVTVYADPLGVEVEVADSRTETVKWGEPSSDIKQVAQFAQSHGGFLSCRNCPEGGAAYTMYLPVPNSLRSAA